MQMTEIRSILKDCGVKEEEYVKPQADLPVLFHYGRADMTVSFFGSNISPTDVQETISNLPAFEKSVHSFCMTTAEDQEGNKQLIVSIELKQSRPEGDPGLSPQAFFDQLASVNQDFREARRMLADENRAILKLHEFGKGPFTNADMRIKARYIY